MLGTNDKYVDVVVGKSGYVWWWRRVGAHFYTLHLRTGWYIRMIKTSCWIFHHPALEVSVWSFIFLRIRNGKIAQIMYLYFRLLKFLNLQISEATRVRHFTLHHSLLATILKRLPGVAENLGKCLFKPFLEEFMGSVRIDHVACTYCGNLATVLQNSESTIFTGRHLLRLRERQRVGQGGRRAGGGLPQRVPGTQHMEGARGAIPSEVSRFVRLQTSSYQRTNHDRL